MKLKFGLITLFLLTAIIAMATSWYVERQETREAEMASLEGTWQAIDYLSYSGSARKFSFSDPEFKLLRPGVFQITNQFNGDVNYAIYKWNGDHLVFHQSQLWYQAPKDFDDLRPDVSWNAPLDADCQDDLHKPRDSVNCFLLERVDVAPTPVQIPTNFAESRFRPGDEGPSKSRDLIRASKQSSLSPFQDAKKTNDGLE